MSGSLKTIRGNSMNMDGFRYSHGELYCEGAPATSLAAQYGTPLYVYCRFALTQRLKELRQAFHPAHPLICYSVKANSNSSILRLLGRANAGFDIVSGGELFRVLRAGGAPSKIVFAGVGKAPDEIAAALRAGIHMFNVESEAELSTVDALAERFGRKAKVALRLNPNVDARTHTKTSTGRKGDKFGIDLPMAHDLFADRARYPHLEMVGVHVHLGSPLYSVAPIRRALLKVRRFIREVRKLGASPGTLNVGGGFCISYDGRKVIRPADYAAAILPVAKELGMQLIIEPGRFIVGNSAILLSRVIYTKGGWAGRKFVIIDAAMNDLIRPALYGAYHHIWPVRGPVAPLLGAPGRSAAKNRLETVDIVGPICETSDCLARDRRLPPVKSGDLLAIFGAGAYGMTMSSTYNSRPRAAEVLVSGRRTQQIRKRESYRDLVRGE
jgi:diaminopimelate decarboxylase